MFLPEDYRYNFLSAPLANHLKFIYKVRDHKSLISDFTTSSVLELGVMPLFILAGSGDIHVIQTYSTSFPIFKVTFFFQIYGRKRIISFLPIHFKFIVSQ